MPARSCHARFGLDIFIYYQLLRLHAALLSVVTNAWWVESFDRPSAKHPVKIWIMGDARWNHAIALPEVVLPVVMIVKLGDFHKPAPPRLCQQMILCGQQWRELADECGDDDEGDTDEAVARGLAAKMLILIEDTIVMQEDTAGKKTYLNRWRLIKSDIALVAHAFDPRTTKPRRGQILTWLRRFDA